jgi:hypothetical protein
MQRNPNPGILANRAPRFSAPQPAARIFGLAGVAPPVYRQQMASLAVQPKMPIGTAKRPAAPPVFRPQQAPIMLQLMRPSTQTRIAGHALQPFAKGVIQAKCFYCHAGDHNTKNCPKKRTAPTPTPTPRTATPSTLGSSHSHFSPSGKPVGHGRKAAEGGHNSDKRRRQLEARAANSIANAQGNRAV